MVSPSANHRRGVPTRAVPASLFGLRVRRCPPQIVDGALATGMNITAAHHNRRYQVQEVGLLSPARHPVDRLTAGQVRPQ